MARVAAALLAAAAVWPAAQVVKPKLTRAPLVALESAFDASLNKLGQDDPFDLLGNTRAVYLDGYGVVMTTELSLIPTPILTPFRPAISKEEAARVHERKLRKLPVLRQAMRNMLVAAAASLNALPPNDQVVLGVTLFYFSWEDRSGLPAQIVMRASKSSLLDYQQGKSTAEALRASILVEEF